jgi:hypothetical protein
MTTPAIPKPDPPRLEPLAPGTESCGCCEGSERQTPREVVNRAGLPAISYRIGTHAEFRASLLAGLSRLNSGSPDRHAGLSDLKTRTADDFTIGLLDAFACTADVLTFYQERIANESYLGTASERISLQEMGRLIGHALRPGVAAETLLAFTFESAPAPPASARPEPGMFVTGVPAEVTVASGLAVRSLPAAGEQPQVFETVEALTARPAWNALQPWLGAAAQPSRGSTFTHLAGVATRLKPGDALLIVGAEVAAGRSAEQWEFRILDSVVPDLARDSTRVAWRRPLVNLDPPDAASAAHVYALRRRASVYGHNAPAWGSMPVAFRTDYEKAFPRQRDQGPAVLARAATVAAPGGGSGSPGTPGDGGFGGFGGLEDLDDLGEFVLIEPENWPRFRISPAAGSVDVDSVQPEIASGSYVVLAKGAFDHPAEPAPDGAAAALFSVSDVTEVSRNEFALSGKVTRLALQATGRSRLDVVRDTSVFGRSDRIGRAGSRYAQFRDDVRGTSVFGQAEPLALAEYPVSDPVAGAVIPVNAPPDGLQPGRRLIVRGTRIDDGAAVVHDAMLTLAAAGGVGRGGPRALLHIDPPLPAPLARASVVVHANVALAVHGETVSQILGAGDAAVPFQRFELKHLPLTWRAAPNASGVAAELTVRVDGVAWSARETLFGSGPLDRAYALQDDAQGRVFVQFGDGARGARPSSGTNNLRATYRKGLGAAGNVAAESLTQPAVRPLGLKGVSNPAPAAGGADADQPATARTRMPLLTRTLGRAVSVLDYEDMARAFAGVAKARAQVLALPGGPVIAITVAGPANAVILPGSPIWTNLAAAFAANGDPNARVRLLPHRPATFRLGLKVKRDPAWDPAAVLVAVETALRERFGFEARALGAAVQQSGVIAVAQGVPGVVAVDLDDLYGGT